MFYPCNPSPFRQKLLFTAYFQKKLLQQGSVVNAFCDSVTNSQIGSRSETTSITISYFINMLIIEAVSHPETASITTRFMRISQSRSAGSLYKNDYESKKTIMNWRWKGKTSLNLDVPLKNYEPKAEMEIHGAPKLGHCPKTDTAWRKRLWIMNYSQKWFWQEGSSTPSASQLPLEKTIRTTIYSTSLLQAPQYIDK